MNPPDDIPVLTELVGRREPAARSRVVHLERRAMLVPEATQAALQAEVVERALDLTNELLHNAAREIEAVMFERVLDRLHAALPDLVATAIRDHLQGRRG
jgi:hypothetical protein